MNECEALQAEQEEMTAHTRTNSFLTLLDQPIIVLPTASSTNHQNITMIQLTPTRHQPNDFPLQQAMIGMDGLWKLHLHLNCDQMQLEIKEAELVEDGED